MRSVLSSLTEEAIQAAMDEFDRLGRDEFLRQYGFGRARDYFVRNPVSGTWCDSKAIAGVAIGFTAAAGGPLQAGAFSGGEAAIATRLSALGFEMTNAAGLSQASSNWSQNELSLTVADYLSMLTLELNGQVFNKAQRRRALQVHLRNRSEASIEFKRCNISAAMVQLGFPYLSGYKPRSNFQGALSEEISKQIQGLAALDQAAEAAVERPAVEPDIADFSLLLAEAPPPAGPYVREDLRTYTAGPVRRDYLEREARNRSLGHAGEVLALRFEKWRLMRAGATELAAKVDHVATTQGDGLGYDILSFETDGRERFIEVKTTAFGQKTPFFVTANEAQFARTRSSQFKLYRFFEFRSEPRMFELAGAIENHCCLDPNTYRARFQ